jgi:hypothetical protein
MLVSPAVGIDTTNTNHMALQSECRASRGEDAGAVREIVLGQTYEAQTYCNNLIVLNSPARTGVAAPGR